MHLNWTKLSHTYEAFMEQGTSRISTYYGYSTDNDLFTEELFVHYCQIPSRILLPVTDYSLSSPNRRIGMIYRHFKQ